MNEKEKDFMERLNNLDDQSVEKIAENYPALSQNAKKRILKQSLHKSGFSADDIEIEEEPIEEEEETEIIEEPEEDEISVSGIEKYDNKIAWHKYAGSAVAMLIAVVGITSVVLLHRNMNENDDFDISSPPFIDETEPMTEIISGSYIDKGYRAGGFDYANINGYEGAVQYGMTTATEPLANETFLTTAPSDIVPETSADDNNYEEVPPTDNNNSNATAPPATNPPDTTVPPVVETTAMPVETEATAPMTEALKSFISGMRYAETDGTGDRMGFEFRPDGTLTMYFFDEYGNIVEGTENNLNYEFIENTFSFGETGNEPFWKTGTVANPNDTGNFIVVFDDSVYSFSTEPPVFAEPEVAIDGVWRTSGMDTERNFTFHEYSMSGSYVTTDNIEITFNYERSGNDITFYFDTGETAKAVVNGKSVISVFDFIWSDGRTEHFYSP